MNASVFYTKEKCLVKCSGMFFECFFYSRKCSMKNADSSLIDVFVGISLFALLFGYDKSFNNFVNSIF